MHHDAGSTFILESDWSTRGGNTCVPWYKPRIILGSDRSPRGGNDDIFERATRGGNLISMLVHQKYFDRPARGGNSMIFDRSTRGGEYDISIGTHAGEIT